jgi:hypothetical protein
VKKAVIIGYSKPSRIGPAEPHSNSLFWHDFAEGSQGQSVEVISWLLTLTLFTAGDAALGRDDVGFRHPIFNEHKPLIDACQNH